MAKKKKAAKKTAKSRTTTKLQHAQYRQGYLDDVVKPFLTKEAVSWSDLVRIGVASVIKKGKITVTDRKLSTEIRDYT